MTNFRIGLHLHPPPRQSLDGFIDTVRRADRYGFARIGTGDTQWHNMECFIALTLMALNSDKVEIGPRVTNPVTREPSVMASAMVSLDLISHGRAVLTIGRGDSAVHNIGLKPASVEETRDYIIAVRNLLENGDTTYRGRQNHFDWPRPAPLRRIPICVTAEGPRMLRLAGQIGDQVLIGTGVTADIVEASLKELHAGARAAGRNPDEITIWWAPRLSIAESTDKAVKNIMASIASSGNHALRSGFAGKQVPNQLKEKIRHFHQEYDYAQHGVKTGKNARLVEKLELTDYFLERFAVAGSPKDIVQRIRALADLGLKNLWLSSPGDDPSALDLMGQEVLPRLNG
ncbi:MAG TPA: LLM class flavin-dependent oxidoreductase [Candidatus Limnocylindrales bacterium]|nr:LLM class flavin-dependent oxidoreductase [Candidatus Limnocylindrales bacterium]